MKKVCRYSMFSMAVLGLILGSAGYVSAITISMVDGDWKNPSPVYGIRINNSGTSGGTSSVRWGIPAGWGGQQSGYDFVSASAPFSPSVGSAFRLGTFSHLNYPITGTSLTSIDLLLGMNISGVDTQIRATFNFQHNETPNYPGMVNDLVTIANPVINQAFTIDGTTYYLNLLGFSQDGGKTIKTEFSTAEGRKNSADLFAIITTAPISAPEPTTILLLGFGLLGLTAARRFGR